VACHYRSTPRGLPELLKSRGLAPDDHLFQADLVHEAEVARLQARAKERYGRGRIINTSSVVAHTGVASAAHYCASKAAIEELTKTIAQEVAAKNITVNSIALGYFDQGLIKDVPQAMLDDLMQKILMCRLGKATELAALVFYLLSEQAEFLTGQVLHLNGGQYA